MGWQNDPIVSASPGAKPAAPWERDPVIGAPAAPVDEGFAPKLGRAVLNAGAGAVRGAGSIGATILAPVDAAVRALNDGRPLEVAGVPLLGVKDRRGGMDAALSGMGADTDSLSFGAGKLGAEIAGTAGMGGMLGAAARALGASPALVTALNTSGMTAGAPAASGVLAGAAQQALRAGAGAAVGAASAGLVDPGSVGTGAIVGAAAPAGVQLAGKAGQAIAGALRPSVNNPALAQKAIDQYGIPLGAADISGSPLVRAARSVLNDAPLTGGIGARQGEAVQQGFNRAIGQTFGANADSLTPQVLDSARQRMGAEFDRIWGRNTLQFDPGLFTTMQTLRANAAKLPQGEAARLSSWLDDIESKMVPDPTGALFMPGDVANRLQSELRRQASRANGFLAEDLQTLRRGILDAFKRSVAPADAAALAQNMGQYKAFKTVEPLLNSAEAGVAGRAAGDVPAALLPQAVRQSYGSNIAGSPFADLTQIGSQYIADRVARTGGGARALVQNSMIGGALGAGAFTSPMTAAAVIPAAVVGQKALGSPSVAKAMLARQAAPVSPLAALLNDPAFQQALIRAAPAASVAPAGR